MGLKKNYQCLKLILFILITIGIAACGSSQGISPNSLNNSSQCQPTDSAFNTNSKLHINHTKTTSSQGMQKLTSAYELLGLRKTNCNLSDNLLNKIQIIYSPAYTKTHRRTAFTFKLRSTTNYAEFESITKKDPCLLSVSEISQEPDQTHSAADWVAYDPYYENQSWLDIINLPDSLDEFYSRTYGISKDVTIAVIDSGVYFDHEDLNRENLWISPGGVVGYNALNPGTDALDTLEADPSIASHGSKIAGIIAASSKNRKGIVGMMPFHAKVMAVRYIDTNGAKSADRINGFEFAAANGADVINLSIGFSNNEVVFRQMIEDYVSKGGFVTTSAGNSRQQLSSSTQYPASWGSSIDGLMTVGGTSGAGSNIFTHTNYSSTYVEIGAPGKDVFTTVGWNHNTSTWGSYYSNVSGTSFSAPIVAGAAGMIVGLLKSHNIPYTGKTIEDIIYAGSLSRNNYITYFKGGKILDMVGIANEVFRRYPQIKDPTVEVSHDMPLTSNCDTF